MSELGIYEGCYVELRNREVVGPLKRAAENLGWPWFVNDGAPCWSEDGFIRYSYQQGEKDIIRVLTKSEALRLWQSEDGSLSIMAEPVEPLVATIPPHVLSAAMGAGIKAEPAYEQFVCAILEAGFKAQYGIEFVPVGEKAAVEQYEDKIDGLTSDLESAVEVAFKRGARDWVRMNYPAQFARLVAANIKNESENRIQDSEKAKGGLSDPIAWHRSDDFLFHFSLGSERPQNNTTNPYEWKPLYDGAAIAEMHSSWRDCTESVSPDAGRVTFGFETREKLCAALDALSGVCGWTEAISSPSSAVASDLISIALPADPRSLLPPEGWYVSGCYQTGKFLGTWVTRFSRLNDPNRSVHGSGENLGEAWQKAREAVRECELDQALDL